MKTLLILVLALTCAFANEKKEVAMSYVLKDRAKVQEQNVENLQAKVEEPAVEEVAPTAVEEVAPTPEYMPDRRRREVPKVAPKGASKSAVDDEMDLYRSWLRR